MIRKLVRSVILTALIPSWLSAVAAGPPNDMFVQRIPLVGTSLLVTGSNRGATSEPVEWGLGVPPSSVWWTWTAPADGTVALESVGATALVRLGALQSPSPGALEVLGGLQRSLYPAQRVSRITFPVSQGLAYAIVAGVEDAVPGGETDFTLALTWWPRPANDAFVNRTRLAGSEPTEPVLLAGATAEPWEQDHRDWFYDLAPFSWLSPPTAWWEWRAPVSGAATVSLVDDAGGLGALAAAVSAQAAIAVTVLAGPEPAQLQLVGRAVGWGPPYVAAVAFEAVAGTTYQIALQAATFPNDPHTLRIRYGQPPRVMLTQPLHGTEWRVGQTVPLEAHAISPGGAVRQVEFQLAQNYDGFAPFATSASNPFTAAWRPTQPGEYRVLAVAVDDPETRSVSFPVAVHVRPANDAFANRSPIPATVFDVAADLANATQDGPGSDGPDIWWSWTPDRSGYHTLELASQGRTRVSLFTGAALAALELLSTTNALAFGDPGNPAFETQLTRLSVAVAAGQTYAIAVAPEFEMETGSVALNVFPGVRPEVTVQRAPDGSLSVGDRVEVSAQASDLDGAVAAVGFWIFGPNAAFTLTTNLTASPYQVTLTNLVAGNYRITAVALDDRDLTSDYTSLEFSVATLPPANAVFAQRTRLNGAPLAATGSFDGSRVWCGWTPSASGDYTVTLTSEPCCLPRLSVYRGAVESQLELIGENASTGFDNDTYATRVTFAAEAGVEYAFSLSAGTFGAGYEVRVNPSRPPAARITQPLASMPIRGAESFTIVAEASDSEGHLVRVDLYLDNTVVASFTQPPFRVVVPITQTWWEGRRVRALATDADGLQTWSASVWAEVYPLPPANDSFANATLMSGFFTDARCQVAGSTREPGEPVIAAATENGSVWYAWTAPADGQVLIMLGADSSSAGLYQGSSLTALASVAVSPLGAARQLVARVAAGTTYRIALEGSARWPSEFTLNLLLLPDPRGTLTGSVLEDEWFLMQGTDFPAGVRVLEVSTDLRTWAPVQTNADPEVHFRAPIDLAVSHRFYRVVTHSGP